MPRESTSFVHRPVMVREVTTIFEPVPPGVVVDATVGGGGHARVLLETHAQISVVGLDRDDEALAAAGEALAPFGSRVRLRRAPFDRIREVVAEEGLDALSGVLFDLGVSSPQLDRPERGFSYRAEGPLDMRMDRRQGRTAADLVNGAGEDELARILAEYGDERFARRVAAAIVAARPIRSTTELAGVVKAAIPAAARRRGGHPAKRTFQALRVAVNDELSRLGPALDDAIDLLAGGGRCAVLAYHSGEDRIVKDRFRRAATGGCTCPSHLPCSCGAVPTVRLLTRGARRPSPEEIETNPRAGSARLRAVERLAPGERAA